MITPNPIACPIAVVHAMGTRRYSPARLDGDGVGPLCCRRRRCFSPKPGAWPSRLPVRTFIRTGRERPATETLLSAPDT